MSLCPGSAKREAMSDGEFWDYVHHGIEPGTADADLEDLIVPDEIEMAELHLTDPCPECGATRACGYDEIGRPMIHTTPPEVES